ncbi:hypothetical protein [Streptomyces sp. NBC_00154]|uniref:hypothetical protein n=1 Tax=Streptomyces sp. NBC_00154 TaxID=2975670 RepID=UPI002256DFDC|nr:hypothetical protein [Streptomyces sp. NBC_00154]MCX5316804.1 hypothetical protein [Streptomyces sp. NBC_00154]
MSRTKLWWPGSLTCSAVNWLNREIPYNQGAYASAPDGDHTYRTDCSGFVSMTWHADTSYTTYSLPSVSSTISKSDLQPGDALNTQDGHGVRFEKWVDMAAGKFLYIHEANTNDDMMRGQDTPTVVPAAASQAAPPPAMSPCATTRSSTARACPTGRS